MPEVKRRFEVHPYMGPDVNEDGRVVRSHITTNDKKRQMETEDVEEDAGYMVYFPSGSSIRVRDDDELRRLGFSGEPELVDMETGEIQEGPADTSLKAHSERTTKPSKPKKLEPTLANEGDSEDE